jgi:PST family polysaccharide transporter
MVISVTALADYLRDLGLSTAAIQNHNLTHAQQTNLFWLNVAMGLSLTTAVAAASPLIARFYHRPEVLWVTVASSAGFLIGSLAAQSSAMLVRNLWFGRQAIATISGALATLAGWHPTCP